MQDPLEVTIEEELLLNLLGAHATLSTRKKPIRRAEISLKLRGRSLVTDHLLRDVAHVEVLPSPVAAELRQSVERELLLLEKLLLEAFKFR